MSDEANSMSEELREAIGPVLGRVPSGVFILTASDGSDRETGMLASWVQQASFEPPLVTVAVNAKRFLNDWLKQDSRVALNLVGESQAEFLKHFGRGFEPDQPAFEGINVGKASNGLTILADALGYLEGNVVNRMETGDHVIYSVAITNAAAGDKLNDEKPMVHIRKNGFGY